MSHKHVYIYIYIYGEELLDNRYADKAGGVAIACGQGVEILYY